MIVDVQHRFSNYDINYSSTISQGIMDKIAEYYTQNDVNYFVKKFFAIFLSDLFLTNFINDSEITENEYLDILSKCSRDKTLV